MRTQAECDGIGPSRTKSWNQPDGHTPTFGGAVIVQLPPEHENSGKMVRPPMIAPCVLLVAAMSEIRMGPPCGSTTFEIVYCPPYAQSVTSMLNVGAVKPCVRYGGMYTCTAGRQQSGPGANASVRTSIRISSGNGPVRGVSGLGSEPEISTRPSGSSVASEWYSRATMVVFRIAVRRHI
jgi:hypothetical protein